jgi:DNA-binding NarL/FixJ family response regulator
MQPRAANEWLGAVATMDEALARVRRQLEAAASDLRLAHSCHEALLRTAREHLQADAGPRLTAQELRVATLAAAGLSNSAIASQLHVSVHTIKTHVRNALEKLGIRSRWQLGDALASERGRADPSQLQPAR